MRAALFCLLAGRLALALASISFGPPLRRGRNFASMVADGVALLLAAGGAV